MSDWDIGDTPEARRARIESMTGLGGSTETLRRLMTEIGALREKDDVLNAASKILGQSPVEVDGIYRVGDYEFEFDDDGKFVGAEYSSSKGGIVIQSDVDTQGDT